MLRCVQFGSRVDRRAGAIFAALIAACLLAFAPAAAATDAGTRIDNSATLTFDRDGVAARSTSNIVSLVTDELLDVAIVAERPAVARTAGDTAVAFLVTNLGNGPETFALAATGDRGTTIAALAADADDDGAYDPAKDATIADARIDLAAGQRRRLFVLVRAPADLAADATVAATARAATGQGAPGTVFTGMGAGGGDAVVGRTGATATAQALLGPGGGGAPVLEKTQTVLAPDGSARVMPGSIITYRLDARFTGAIAAVEIADAIPEGTSFVPGSITLDDRSLTDVADADAATFDGSAIRVALGDIPAAAVRTVRFKVQIQ